ncbi:hypothetical protein HAX54_045209 [Datura stramonium]|uniref:Protein kinase domain-containing protein n=1 Tax=Datura stramonium TaxID=4076 RepID=A0ABS8WJI6_DATST|nr:hypothetical protein [Datura stramonium]
MANKPSPTPSTEGTQISDSLILDTPISSNPPSSPSGTDTRNSPSSKMQTNSDVPFNPRDISHKGEKIVGHEIGVVVDSPDMAKEGIEATREREVGEKSPSGEGGRLDIGDGEGPFVQESGEQSSQEAPTVAVSPKWDRTPTLPEVGVTDPPVPSGPAEGTSPLPDDDEVPIYLVFKRKSRTASRRNIQEQTGTKEGPATRGTVKKSLDLILEESRQNTLKRRRVTREMVMDEEDPSSPIVDLDAEIPSQAWKEALRLRRNLFAVLSFIEAQHRGTEEIECLTMLPAQRDAEIVVLRAASEEVISERMALLELKESLGDPSGILSSWKSDNSSYCSWYGVSCNSNSRVSELRITGNNTNAASCTNNPELAIHAFGIRRNSCFVMNAKLVGNLSPAIGYLSELKVLSLPFHDLTGEIPVQIWELENLVVLDVEGNSIQGNFSSYNFAGLRKLRVLNLGFNRIVGRFPPSLAKCRFLSVLDLAGNGVNGVISGFIGGLEMLRVINLSFNRLIGCLPLNLGIKCRNLEHLDLSFNFLQGEIPRVLGKCSHLRTLLLTSNAFSGVIPSELGGLQKLEVLLLNNNALTGEIPSGLENMTSLHACNISFNTVFFPSDNKVISRCSFLGSSFLSPTAATFALAPSMGLQSNESLSYAAPPQGPQSKNGKGGLFSIVLAAAVSAAVIVCGLAILVVFCMYMTRQTSNPRIEASESPERGDVTVFNDIGVALTYEKILQATRHFSWSNCIGNGGFGSTYKAEISSGVILAVKRLFVERCQGIPQFHAEIQSLKSISHPNLITLIGYFANEAHMFLIYNYLPGGNLEKFIRDRANRIFDYKVLHKIALDIALAIAYLHDECVPRIIHRDVKPSNILLDNELNAHLSDFGLSRIMGTETCTTTNVAGTFGYVAPEYALSCRVSDKADVYSYGIVLLELLSDKRALDPSFSVHENGFNIVSWASMLLRNDQIQDIFYTSLWEAGPEEKLVDVLHLALMCTTESLCARPRMRQIVGQLKELAPLVT